jgi:hypothetical protein
VVNPSQFYDLSLKKKKKKKAIPDFMDEDDEATGEQPAGVFALSIINLTAGKAAAFGL